VVSSYGLFSRQLLICVIRWRANQSEATIAGVVVPEDGAGPGLTIRVIKGILHFLWGFRYVVIAELGHPDFLTTITVGFHDAYDVVWPPGHLSPNVRVAGIG